MLRGRSLATPSAVLSKDAFRKEAALRVEGQPYQCFSQAFALNPFEMLHPHAAHCSGRVAEAVLLRRKYAVV